MTRPHFSTMLFERRRNLGYTTAQASRVLRLREDVLIAFEQGDFDHIPKSGYAQGMLSSYARYLGLNPRLVVSQFTHDLSEYQSGVSSPHRKRGSAQQSYPDDVNYEVPRGAQVRAARERVNSGAKGLLPTSGGYAGDMAGFSAVSNVRSRRGHQNPYVNAASTQGSGGSQTSRPYTTRQPSDVANDTTNRVRDRRAKGRGRVRVDGQDAEGTRRAGNRQPSRQRSNYRPRVPITDEPNNERSRSREYPERDYVTTRQIAPSQYVDDLHYDDHADPYEAASTRRGRASSRDIASTRRPNVRRRQSPSTRVNLRSREQEAPKRSGIVGAILDFFSDSKRTLVFVIVVLAVVLTILIISSVSTCVSNFSGETRSSNKVTVSETDNNSDNSSDTSNDASTDTDTQTNTSTNTEAQSNTNDTSNTNTDTSNTNTTSDTAASSQVEVSVSLASDEVSWIEITLNGSSVVAETKTGPWSDTYTVTDSIKIEASEPSAVTVSENGEQKSFEKKASGVGTLTIKGSGTTDNTSTNTSTNTTSTNTTGNVSA